MVCLLASQDVICIWNDRHVKIMYAVFNCRVNVR